MNARILLNFRVSTLCRLLAVGSLIAGLGLTGCGTKATTDDATSVDNDSTDSELGVTDDADGAGDDTPDTAGKDGTDQDGSTDAVTPADGISGTDGKTGDADAGTDISGDTPDVKPDTGPALPICPEAKGSCALCTLCPAFPICTLAAVGKPDLKTYPNDCAAICALNAVNWPAEVGGQVWPTECPACPLCTPADLKLADPWCVTTNAGTQVNVDHKCEVGCVPDVKMNGTTAVATPGACKVDCTKPVASGGPGCVLKGQPICAKEDNTTYNNQCQMENCNVKGCYPGTAPSAACTPSKMTKECDGACYDKNKTPNCTSECSPVCGVKKVKLSTGVTLPVGTSYRTACIAAADGATVGDCTGISATPTDPCAANTLYKAQGCCPDVEYSIIHPVCGSLTVAGQPDQWVTFQNQGEYDCLTKGNGNWTFQYAEACICNCNNNEAPVCGANGFTYQNACQAKCYNGDAFTYTTGTCSP